MNLKDLVMHAEPDDLILALVRRGAKTRKLSRGRLKVAMVFEVDKPLHIPRPKRQRLIRHNDPRIRLVNRRASGVHGQTPSEAA